jgi:hypothetical protein
MGSTNKMESTIKDQLIVFDENHAIKTIEEAFYGETITIENIVILSDSLGDAVDPYNDCFGSRRVGFDLCVWHDGIKETIPFTISTQKTVYEDCGDSGEVIGSHTEQKTFLEGGKSNIFYIKKMSEHFNKHLPNISFNYFQTISFLEEEKKK